MKVNINRAKEIDKTRTLLKQFLYALRKSEGFGKERLLRVLFTWSEVYEFVNDPRNNSNDEMLLIDSVLEKVIGKRAVDAIGKEMLKDRKGNVII